MTNIIDPNLYILHFIQKSGPILNDLVDNKTLDEVADYFIKEGIFLSKKDVKCFLFDAVPFMVSDRRANMDLPIHYYEEDESIETDIEIPKENNIIEFIKESDKR